ncbi:MAG: hypothetical protein KNN16_04955 [Thermoflexus hugenholtzii]|uniref:hypothetical protein n=1 Tax=Thermoflexus TaxID=1495649 RepID=UPI001C77EE30|nr:MULTISPECIES: hypothetical protein [Thermoflexus]QWK11636.1 MAG: hypothetical protein KNN16_04955 [Thermoflexus hugenholtzii]
MREKGCGIGLVLMAALTAACARPTPEPAFWTVPCPNLPPETPPPTPAETLEKLPVIPTNTPVEIGNFIVRVGNLRWTYEYFDPYTGKPARSECPWLSFEWEARRKTADEGSVHPLFLTGTGPATLEIRLYLGIGHFRGPDVAAESEAWDPDPERKGEAGEGYRCRCLVHARPEWDPRWLVIQASRGAGGLLLPIPITLSDPIARVEVPPPPPAPER